MNRREFLKTYSAVVAATSVASPLHASLESPGTKGRAVLPMNRGWRFRQQPGTVRLTATHPRLGSRTAEFKLTAAEPEQV